MQLDKFVFETPLYMKVDLPDDAHLKHLLAGLGSEKADGFCPPCGQASTFKVLNGENVDRLDRASLTRLTGNSRGFYHLTMSCARNDMHQVKVWYLLTKDLVMKVGQLPSLADIANDEAREYTKVLDKDDAAELHKAIGLAAHGVGVGSFVYLRRVFENLINGRFNEFKDDEGWSDNEFKALRMDDKVKLLKDHVPEFLYDNRKLYSILSKGIHELSEEVCLKAFEPLKLSIKIILEEDKKKKEELDLKKKAAEAIKALDF